jgi:hypothetical protein
LWLNIRFGEAPNKTEDAAGRMLVCVCERERGREREREGERERVEAVTAFSLLISAL